jgi:hypothetical protein
MRPYNIFLCAYLLFNPIFFYALICYSIQYFFMRLSAIQSNIFLCAYLLFNPIFFYALIPSNICYSIQYFFMRLFHPISAIQYYIFYALIPSNICYSILYFLCSYLLFNPYSLFNSIYTIQYL